MTVWTHHTLGAMSKSAEHLVSLSMHLQRKLASQSDATSPDEVRFILRQIETLSESMSHIADMAKVQALLTPAD